MDKQEIKAWLLANCLDKYGDLDLTSLDFSDFEGDVKLSDMKVKKNLFQGHQTVEGSLYQGCQEVKKYLYQSRQTAKDLYQSQQVAENIYQGHQDAKYTLCQDK